MQNPHSSQKLATSSSTPTTTSGRVLEAYIPAQRGAVPFDRNYYRDLEPSSGGSRRSADVIAPLMLDILRPTSVVDVGCGLGSWLAAFQANGVEDVLGIDLDNVDRDLLLIPAERFLPANLRQPLKLDRTFDLALCCEVAGFLPSENAAVLVDSLVHLSAVVAFSAPIPLQGGPNAINEQWPDYWTALFAQRGYVMIDPIRRVIWDRADVKWWFAQNLLVFIREDLIASNPLWNKERERAKEGPLSLVHPRLHTERDTLDTSLKRALLALPRLFATAIRRRVT